MELYSLYLNGVPRDIYKAPYFFPIYERHFNRFRGLSVVVLEIGCGWGGSPHLWKRYLGPLATVVGIDRREECINYEDDLIKIRIGEQADTAFLANVVSEFGPPDIVIDDGSHRMTDQLATFEFLYPRLSRNGIYLVEDVHTSYWPEYGGGIGVAHTFLERCKSMIDELNAHHTRGALRPTGFTEATFSMHFYDSVVVFERGTIPCREQVRIEKGSVEPQNW